MARIKMMATGDPGMWRRRGMPRSIRIPTDSDEEAMENPPTVPNNANTEMTKEEQTRRPDTPNVQRYSRRNKVTMIAPPPAYPTVAMDTPEDEMPPEATTSTGHGQKRPRTPSPPPPPPPPSPERQQRPPLTHIPQATKKAICPQHAKAAVQGTAHTESAITEHEVVVQTEAATYTAETEPATEEIAQNVAVFAQTAAEMAEFHVQPAAPIQRPARPAVHADIEPENPVMRAPIPRERTLRELAAPMDDQAL
ncbi:swi5-dependent recombination DNA repair protein 1 homolog [Manihot esculenta]|uniref:swi5-dependent recombination DNA repair protein 1 homolog n=1 Tax=Manihot esculenta TaxID=3983 RepID=UPI000B5D175C|nr:swi5-dependent recombination DNA repair protein 1 homolog [Manihot esculenta]